MDIKSLLLVLRRVLAYSWASPATALGLLFVPLAWLTGGRASVVQGAIEVQGGLVTKLLRRGLPVLGPAAAMTIGHVILGRDQECLDQSRRHEHVHVRQYERWGVLLLPLYLASSAAAWIKGLDPYLDNRFEKEAFGED
jgi:hypothetical protein